MKTPTQTDPTTLQSHLRQKKTGTKRALKALQSFSRGK